MTDATTVVRALYDRVTLTGTLSAAEWSAFQATASHAARASRGGAVGDRRARARAGGRVAVGNEPVVGRLGAARVRNGLTGNRTASSPAPTNEWSSAKLICA